MKYALIIGTHADWDEFVERINAKIAAGWEVAGGISSTSGPDDIYLYQAMIDRRLMIKHEGVRPTQMNAAP